MGWAGPTNPIRHTGWGQKYIQYYDSHRVWEQRLLTVHTLKPILKQRSHYNAIKEDT